MALSQHISRTEQFLTTVSAVGQLSPRMRRLTLSSPAIGAQTWPLACDIAVVLTGSDGRELRRRYTVRRACDDSVTVDAVLHGHGPGSAWASTVQVGDNVAFFGPRGGIQVADADCVLALTDEAGLPAVAAIAEALARPIRVLAEIADDAERYPLPANAQVTWLPRGGRPAGDAEGFLAALTPTPPPPTPPTGYAYVLGESRAVARVRDELSRRALDRSRVYAKGYWNLNSRSTL